MLILDIEIVRRGAAALNKREWNRILRAAYRIAAQFWLKEIRPKHFTRSGGQEYRYAPRQGEAGNKGRKSFFSTYTGQKQRQKGHQNPLSWSGTLERESSRSPITATRKGSRVRVRGRVLNLRVKNPEIDMAREVSAISGRDVRDITRTIDRFIDSRLRLIDRRLKAQITIQG